MHLFFFTHSTKHKRDNCKKDQAYATGGGGGGAVAYRKDISSRKSDSLVGVHFDGSLDIPGIADSMVTFLRKSFFNQHLVNVDFVLTFRVPQININSLIPRPVTTKDISEIMYRSNGNFNIPSPRRFGLIKFPYPGQIILFKFPLINNTLNDDTGQHFCRICSNIIYLRRVVLLLFYFLVQLVSISKIS